jgi:hypothetical protein
MRYVENDAWQTFKLPSEHKSALRRVAAAHDVNPSELLRQAVEILIQPSTPDRSDVPRARLRIRLSPRRASAAPRHSPAG